MVGRILILAAMVSTVVATASAQDLPKATVPTVAAHAHGRYQIVISPFTERSTYLLDTETGAVWQLEALATLNGEPLVWNLMPRVDTDADMADIVSRFGKKPGTKATQPGPPRQ
jgi:hypothetical protein